jgi:4-hydroxy-3-polyprenylbenzoate decarboxylase
VPAFYHRPKTLDDIINQTVSRALDQFDIETDLFQRWGELKIEKSKRELGEVKPALSAHKKE